MAALAVLSRASYEWSPVPVDAARWGTWVLFGLLVLGTIMNLASRSRLERWVQTPAHVDGDAPSGFSAMGICRWGGVQQSGDLFVDANDGYEDMSLVGLTNVVPAGQGYTFAIECREGGNAGVHYTNAWITAVAISPS